MKLPEDKKNDLLGACLDNLCELFGKEYVIQLGIDAGLTKKEVADWCYDDGDVIDRMFKENGKEG